MKSRSILNFFRAYSTAALLLAALPATLVLGACVDAEAQIRINSDGAGIFSLNYRVPASLRYLLSDPDQPWELPLPKSRADADALVAGRSDISVSEFSLLEDAASINYKMNYEFKSADSLVALLKAMGATASFGGPRGASSFSLALASLPSPAPESLASLALGLYGPSRLRLRFTPPIPPRAQSGGIVEKGDALFVASSDVLATSGKSPVWEVSW